jgi:hypothetical protein
LDASCRDYLIVRAFAEPEVHLVVVAVGVGSQSFRCIQQKLF